jgi:hypothetical protein
VIEIFPGFFEFISSQKDYFIPYVNRQASCEKWLQGEFIWYLYECKKIGAVVDANLEKVYGPKAGFCDIWFKTNEKEIWCELEVIVTNYNLPGKPITNQVQHVIDDIEKLKKCPSQDGEQLVMFVVYPMPVDKRKDDLWNSIHMSRIANVAEVIAQPSAIRLSDSYEARIYLARPKME